MNKIGKELVRSLNEGLNDKYERTVHHVVLVELKANYGRTRAYPANDLARTLAELAGTKTLTKRDLELAKKLGFKVEVDEVWSPNLEDLE